MLRRPPFEVSSCVEKFREQKLNGSSLAASGARDFFIARIISCFWGIRETLKQKLSWLFLLSRERMRRELDWKLTSFFFFKKVIARLCIYNLTPWDVKTFPGIFPLEYDTFIYDIDLLIVIENAHISFTPILVFSCSNLLLSGQGFVNPFNDMPGIRMLLEECQSRFSRIRKTSKSVSYRGIRSSKKRTHLPLGFHSQYEASCQKEIVFPFYLVASKNVMKSVFAEESRIGPQSNADNEIVYSQKEIWWDTRTWRLN